MYGFIPSTMVTTAIRNMTPISTPTMEKLLLSFCAQIMRSASRMASKNAMVRLCGCAGFDYGGGIGHRWLRPLSALSDNTRTTAFSANVRTLW